MDCEQAVSLICARLDHELRSDDRAALDGHLIICGECRATEEAFALQDGALRRVFAPRRRAAASAAGRIVERVAAPARPRPRLRTFAALTAFAGGLAAAALFLLVDWLPPRPKVPSGPGTVVAAANFERLTPRPRPTQPQAVALVVGQSVETKAGERRRLALPSGGTAYLDQNTRFKLDAEMQGTLSSGAVYFDATVFQVQTADRTVSTIGRCEVRSDGARSAVYCAHGAALIAPQGVATVGIDPASLVAGQQMAAGNWQAAPAPRASACLDWTRELIAESETPLVPASSYGGGALIAVDANGQEAKLSLRKYHVDVYVEDGFARTTIDQTYFNHHPWRLEGTFYFPLPPDASLSRLAMYVDGNLMEGGMAERDYARAVYQQIVSSQKDPALLEWVDGSTFKMRVFPLEGRQEKRIVLSYTQRLPELYGKTTYRFPAGHSLQMVRDWSFAARVKAGAPLQWASPTHPSLRGTTEGVDLVLTDAAANVKADRDVAIELTQGAARRQPAGSPAARFAGAELDGQRYLMLRWRPELSSAGTPARRDWVFLVEASADRDPLLARVQIEIVRQMLSNAGPNDTFTVVAAGTRAQRFALQPLGVSPEQIALAATYLEQTQLIGALDLGTVFDNVAEVLANATEPWLVHVGSGYTAMGTKQEELAKRLPRNAHYVGIGVGKRWNRAFMKDLAEKSGGHFTQINPDEPIAWRAFDLMATLNTPRLLGVTVTAAGPAGQPLPPFLTDAATLCQGEELCAAARLVAEDGSPLPTPASVTVRGTLDGKPFAQTLPVQAVEQGAGYLPRTWAKLEVDRLVTEGAAANGERIVQLSKAMYVMSPFTSLLVLENEAMYEQFKVDRGRKDHWAMYPCPANVPVVYEPDPTQPVDVRNAPKGLKPQASQVTPTIVTRPTPRYFLATNGRQVVLDDSPSTLALLGDVSNGTPMTGLGVQPTSLKSLPYLAGAHSYRNASATYMYANLPRLWGENGRPEPGLQANFFREVTFSPDGRQSALGRLPEQREVIAWESLGETDIGLDVVERPRLLQREKLQASEFEIARRFAPAPGRQLNLEGAEPNNFGYHLPALSPALRRQGGGVDRQWYKQRESDEKFSLILGRPEGLLRGANAPSNDGPFVFPQVYQRQQFADDARLFSDLAAYAPGLNTSPADIQAVLESEAAPDLRAAPGHVEPEARRLLDSARAGGWQALSLPQGKGQPDLVLSFDAAGRYAFERTLPFGLRERVVCDGSTLLHLYPELGIGARRTVTRFHRAELTGLLPWLVPPADDLARGADVRRIDERTVAIVPHGDNVRLALHFVLDSGRLAERRVVEIASKKVLAREVYDGAGGVRLLDAEGKERGKSQLTVRAAPTPDLKPDTSALVVLPLPFRSREHVFARLELDPAQGLAAEQNGCHVDLDSDEALQLLAVALATQNANDARMLFDDYFYPRGDRRRGLFTLATACGVDLSQSDALRAALANDPSDPLLRYLTLLGNSFYTWTVRYLPVQVGATVGAPDSLFRRLAELRELKERWSRQPSKWVRSSVRRLEVERTVAFVRRNGGSLIGWSLLSYAQDRVDCDRERINRAFADAWGFLAESGGDAYAARYEQARLLLHGSRAQQATQRFLRLYTQTLKDGYLPTFDGSFREALRDGDAWGKLMRETAKGFVQAKQRSDAIALAWQCRHVGDAPLGDQLLAMALAGPMDDAERLPVSLVAVEFLRRTADPSRADLLLQGLMAQGPYASDARLWRLRAGIAANGGHADAAIAHLERALDLEYKQLPEIIDLTAWRRDYGQLLEHYGKLAASAKTLKAAPPNNLAARTVQAADRWRAHDPEAAGACETAAQVLADLGDGALSWDYVTTGYLLRGEVATTWRNVAAARHAGGDFVAAEKAYAVACAAEPHDALLVWHRAQNLQQAGSAAAADALLQRLVADKWPREFDWIRERARWQREGR